MNTKELLCPSGFTVEIRETTGADDDLFSGSTIKDYEIINKYISAIVVKGPNGGSMTIEDVEKMRIRDKYFILFSSRIFSLGPELIFTHQWDLSIPPQEYSVDLSEYLWDYSKPFPGKGEEGFFDQRIPPYDQVGEDGYIRISLPGNPKKELRFKFLDGKGEKYLLNLTADKRSINKQLIARDLQILDNNKWVTIVNFNIFTAREMVIIRQAVETWDKEIMGLVSIFIPELGQIQTLSILGITDFFFPTRI